MARKKDKKKKGSKEKDSESSTPQSSTASVGDETRPLLQGGARASRDGHESTPSPKPKGDGRRIGQRKETPYQSLGATSSTNPPQSGHSSRTAVPNTASSASPSRGFSRFFRRDSKSTKLPNRPSNSECHCEDKENHHPDCPEFKNISAGEKEETGGAKLKKPIPNASPQPSSTIISKKSEDGTQSSSSTDPSVADYSSGATESDQRNISADAKAEFGGAKPKKPIPRKSEPPSSTTTNKDGTQSSSSSDPSVSDYSRGATEFEEPSEKSLLLVPDQGAEVHSTSPSKKTSPFKNLKGMFDKNKAPNRSSDAEGNSDDKTDSERELPKQGKNKTGVKDKSPSPNQTKSKVPSGSGSSILKKDKNVSSSKSGRSNSKSSSDLDPNVEVCSGKGKRASKLSPGNASSSKSTSDAESSGSLLDADPPGATSSGSARCGDTETRRDVDQQQRPLSSKYASSRSPSRVPFDRKAKLPKIRKTPWAWLDAILARARRNRDENVDPAINRPGKNENEGPAVNTPDESEQRLLNEVEDVRRDSTVRRHESTSRVPLEAMVTRRHLDTRNRARNRPDGNERRLPRHVEESGSSSAETERHRSHSPNLRVRACPCPGRTGRDGVKVVFNHEIGCPQQIDLRRRRKRRQCRLG